MTRWSEPSARRAFAVSVVVGVVATLTVLPAAPAAVAGQPTDPAPVAGYNPLTPARLLDTRAGLGAPSTPVGPGGTLDLRVTGVGGVPEEKVGAVVLNVTGTQPSTETFVTVWPAGDDRPLASNLNLKAGETRPNLVVVGVGAAGSVSLYNNRGTTHLVADVMGWMPEGDVFEPTLPSRLLDTRIGNGAPASPIGAKRILELQVAGVGPVPTDGVGAVVLNVTGTGATAQTFATVWPSGQPKPLASNLNLAPGQTAPNLVIVEVGANGNVSLFNDLGSTHFVADVLGWFPDDAPYRAVTPTRLTDTRLPVAAPTPLGVGQVLELAVTGVAGVPSEGVGAVVLNVTGTQSTADTFLTAWPAGAPRPLASNLNLSPGTTSPNLVIARVGADGKVTLFNNRGSTHLVIDLMGWFPIPRFLDPETAARCEFLDPTECLLVWPSDHLTTLDPSTDTGRRLDLQVASMPRNTSGISIDPLEFNRSDGFSPGTMIVARVPGIDLDETGAPPLGDLSRSLEPDSPMVILDATTGERHPFWAELDPNAPDERSRALMLRPAVNFAEGHRYIVALRGLRNAGGQHIEANTVFSAYRDAMPTGIAHVEGRRPAMESIFSTLSAAGIARQDLYLAWDFTVASQRSLAERMLHIRDDSFAALGAAAPGFAVTGVQEMTPAEDSEIARRVEGTLSVPLYLNGTGATGSTFNWGAGGMPQRNGSITASFSCRVPRSASAADPARISLYGHGLLGSRSEVNAGNVRLFANEHNIVFCATDWIGMSGGDLLTVVGILQDMSKFPQLADRVQQGILNTLFLGRLMKHPSGLASHAAFRDGTAPLIDTSELFYDGNSQGGIIGGAATAVAQDWTRAVLGVPGMNYSLMLRRSSDWPAYASIFEANYTDRLDQTLILAMIQTQWDRAEANGYAHHMTTDPYPGTPHHQVLLHVAFGDFQVPMWSAEIEARTIGAHLRQPALAPGRHPDVNPFFGIPAVPTDEAFTGSVLVYWDSGTPPPPSTEQHPTAGGDPHSRPRAQAAARVQKSEFFDGVFVDVCGVDPCLAP
jgi:hypothetical protein